MEHVALYRRFRPQTFDEVYGQDHIVTTLKNQIKNDQISHAYLFSGTRGTGKTSIAKIFARSINCTNSKDGIPCGECTACKSLKSGDNLDIIEIDAASNNGVDNIRELKESIIYPPTISRYKVYIIDEVHMLSESAFNALLKTLEEPPKYVVFILATTEVQKLPQTILSRCVRFDFRLVSPEVLSTRLKYILDTIGVTYEDSAIKLIASLGEGSVRDTLSIAESCVAFCGNHLTYDNVLDVAGITSKDVLAEMSECIINRNTAKILNVLSDMAGRGKNFAQLNKDLVSFLRDVSIIKNCANASTLLSIPEDIYARMMEIAKSTDNDTIIKILSRLASMEQEFRYTTDAKSLFEITILSLMDESDRLAKLEARVSQLETQLNTGVHP
ncbi:MAG: DNA polymerase III subunit gamma/tau [Clostridiales bacterium]|nr:DNA polymerase III subunit gamma/tau [Clostridiales bacterium]